ncbi:class I SAM-dependent methyltransferase [Parerythrobacter lacustris]|uniref:Class I SAM-dependent methyltransferase n=1 Tax=Parerythrobacter lacustris TaxID=2969984 RepID=A0ABT1XTM7_9SPHN|nr:class I SAM-dependent methyltransferase [Parerythrobacter lacustris]MCR2835025.1 class I SAM-dependent methyltransferase [Parerythrobacter lacustris]
MADRAGKARPAGGEGALKRHAPATARNSEAIAEVLAAELSNPGTVLEIASGSGEHAVHFARRFPHFIWQPTDADPEAVASIEAWREESRLANIAQPVLHDAATEHWPAGPLDAIFCANMIHISPWDSAMGLFAGAGRCLAPGGKLVVYGPFFEQGVEPAQSNLDFDASLRSRDPRWGIRKVEDCDRLARDVRLERSARHEMPANNLTLVWTRRP